MTFEQIMDEQKEDKKIVDSLGIPYLDYTDINVCNYVSNQLASVEMSNAPIMVGKKISFDELINASLSELSIFDDSLRYDLLDILNSVYIHRIDDNFGFGAYVNYKCGINSNDVQFMGKISGYSIPNNLYELSTCFLCHEHIHSLKDTIYYEYLYNKTLGETIPMFYELISCGNNISLRNEVIKVRMKFLLNNMKEYIFFYDLINKMVIDCRSFDKTIDLDEIDLYHFARSKVGCYLNSFYYAIILYNLYQENSKKILDLVSMVLRQEMTTFQLLEYLDIYGDIKGSVFERELCKIKKIVK